MRQPCCEANDFGFPCQCIQNDRNSQQAEDEGICDWLYDQERDRRDMENDFLDDIMDGC